MTAFWNRHDTTPEKKPFIDSPASGFSRSYDGVDEDKEFVKREGSSSRKGALLFL